MKRALDYLWRHPRRTGFIVLNLVVLAAFLAWGTFTADMSREGIGGVPNLMLGYTGLALLVVLWIAAWLAWAYLVAVRQLRRTPGDCEQFRLRPRWNWRGDDVIIVI